MRDFETARDKEAAVLVARETPESLATASVLLSFKRGAESVALLNRAAALEPRRAQIIYLQWNVCVSHQCAEEAQIRAALKAVDPGNGVAWLPDLSAAWERADQAGVTEIVARIGASRGLSIYWNSLTVMMVDAMGGSARRAKVREEDPATRMITVSGMLAAVSIPPLQPLTKPCHADQFEQPGRRAACEAMTARLQQSDTMIMRGLGLGMQQRWWPEGSRERENLNAQRQQDYYLSIASSRERIFHLSKDRAARLDAMRKTNSEAELMRAMLILYHEPLERPLNWKDPYAAKINSQASN